jgi:hypothetical protein
MRAITASLSIIFLKIASYNGFSTSVADPHHSDADTDSACDFDADPDPTFYLDANPDPDPTTKGSKPIKRAQIGTYFMIYGTFWLVICKFMRIRIQLSL